MNTHLSFEDAVAFHGHACPGLAIGYRMTLAALGSLSEQRALDEEIVAIVENDACGVDAVQLLSGCTFGKGNLIFRDYGKAVYTFYSRHTGKGIRVVWKDSPLPREASDDRSAMIEWILETPQDEVVSIQSIHIDAPAMARIHDSIWCDSCGERTIATRIREVGNQQLCIPCWERAAST